MLRCGWKKVLGILRLRKGLVLVFLKVMVCGEVVISFSFVLVCNVVCSVFFLSCCLV